LQRLPADRRWLPAERTEDAWVLRAVSHTLLKTGEMEKKKNLLLLCVAGDFCVGMSRTKCITRLGAYLAADLTVSRHEGYTQPWRGRSSRASAGMMWL